MQNPLVCSTADNNRQPPDLNLIQEVWDELDIRLTATQPSGATHWWELLQSWKNVVKNIGFNECVQLVYLMKESTLSQSYILVSIRILLNCWFVLCFHFRVQWATDMHNLKNQGVVKLVTSSIIKATESQITCCNNRMHKTNVFYTIQMCSFIVLMPSVRIYHVNSHENKEHPLNKKVTGRVDMYI